MELTIEMAKNWLLLTNEAIQENKSYLTKLDQAIGDGDHGINMARGFSEVKAKIEHQSYDNVAEMMKDTAMTLLSKVGGAAGPLYGTAFLRISQDWQGKATINEETIISGLKAGMEGMKQRGKAETGEKTLIDLWEPVIAAAEENFSADIIQSTAKEAFEATRDMQATKGRASYLGVRSVGHLDPGSCSSYYLFSALADSVKGAE